MNFLELRQTIEKLIADYRLKEATRLLKDVDHKAIPLSMRSDFAQLARRAHLHNEALKILQDKVYGTETPSDEDVLEYASSIRKIGMVQQCLNLLERVDDCKEKWLYQAFCYVHQWDYANAGIYFSKVLRILDLGTRDVVVAKLNLVSCCIHLDDYGRAEQLIEDILPECKQNFFQFYLNCLELRGQIYLKRGDLDAARTVLSEAVQLAREESGTTTLFIEKWSLIADLIDDKEKALLRVPEFKKKIRAHGHWETLRDFDYHVAMATGDVALLNYVYFGTPFTQFRDKMQSENKDRVFAEKWLWIERRYASPVSHHLDPLDMQSLPVAYGLIQHRLMLLLLSDFYRPWSVPRIFDSLFPDEIFDPHSSTKRVYALIKKLQDVFKEQNIPYVLQATIYGYRLRHQAGGLIHIYDKMLFDTAEAVFHYALTKKYGVKSFSVRDLEEIVPLSRHKIYRLLKDLEQADLIQKDTAASRYKLKAS